MIVGIGTDIVQVDRIHSSLERLGDRFAKRILTTVEMELFATHANPSRYLAKRFAAKEAASKALGTGIGKVSFRHLEVTNNHLGAPQLELLGYAAELQLKMGISSIHLSLSDEVDYAVAFVILESTPCG